jgi:uncharacterized protein YegL
MKQDYTDITILLDKSSSMSGCWGETLQGLNKFISEQKEVNGKLSISIHTFDTRRETLLAAKDIKTVGTITDCKPDGMTALNDALCDTIDEVGSRLAITPEIERPTKVMFVILTDGGENSSRRRSKLDVKNRIQHQQTKYSWDFIFLGADYNATEEATSAGAFKNNIYNYDKANTIFEMGKLSNYTKQYRASSDTRSLNFAEEMSKN